MAKTWETRRLYRYEMTNIKHFPKALSKRRSMKYLRTKATEIWGKHGRNGIDVPDIKAWNGTTWSSIRQGMIGWSYSEGFKVIKLGRDYRTLHYLLHELVHCMGYNTHGRGFVKKYTELLVEYGGIDEGELVIGMGMFGIKVPAWKSE
jgi:hypothetical protein